ncbi:MAG: hypothetical protein Q8K75_06885 [Chlamydiales bacterium]|nr:hypothetical protein [Chlamydiales bacterium]
MDAEKLKFFDEKKRQQAATWINEKCENLFCECCHNKSWILSEDMVMPLSFTGGGLTIGGPAYPHIMVVCKTCGNAKFFNAVIMGLVETQGVSNA